MHPDLHRSFDETMRDRWLLDHPFYRRWEAGELTRAELTSYAEQYGFFEALLPAFLATLSGQLDGAARELVEANLADEVTPPSHLELFERFARHYGARDVPASPAMSRLLDAYASVLDRGSVRALAGLLAYESQGAPIADSKGSGLATYYGASEDALEFWREHGTTEVDHAAWTFDALAALDPDPDEVAEGARLVGDAWWSFLDERELLRGELTSA